MPEFHSRNPFDEAVFAHYEGFDLSRLDPLMEDCTAAQTAWRSSPFAERARLLESVAGVLDLRREELTELCSREMGKPLTQARAEVDKCAWVCRYYAEEGEAQLADRAITTERRKSYVSHHPLGLLLLIMPWNFPYWQVFRVLAPALMAGNGVLLKHASNVPGCSLAIEKVLREAGAPANLMRSLLVASSDAEALIAHPRVQGVSFTGSSGAGARIAATAGRCLRKTVLELGGSDPYLVLADADLEASLDTCVASRLINTGQSCIAAKRFIVHDSLYEAFVDGMARRMAAKRLGDPLREDTDVGPLARADLCGQLAEQVAASVSAGARCVIGGEAQGNCYLPTVLAEVRPGMPAFDDELFGPVAAVIRAGDDDEAIVLANRSPFGLGAAVFSQDLQRAETLARDRLEAGACFVNAFVASDPRLPFGGIKASGYGRELGELGIREFCNIKTVVVA